MKNQSMLGICEGKLGYFVALWPRHCPPTLLIEMYWGAVLWPEASFLLGLETNVGLSGVGKRMSGLGVLWPFGQDTAPQHF